MKNRQITVSLVAAMSVLAVLGLAGVFGTVSAAASDKGAVPMAAVTQTTAPLVSTASPTVIATSEPTTTPSTETTVYPTVKPAKDVDLRAALALGASLLGLVAIGAGILIYRLATRSRRLQRSRR